jgi:DNA-binding CsgD family transcriptional regulator
VVLRFAERASRPTAILGALQVALGDLVYWHGDVKGAVAVGDHLQSAGQRYGSIPAQAEALAQLAGIRTFAGDLTLGRDIWQRAHDLITRLGPEQPLRFTEIEIGARLAYLGGGERAALGEAALDYTTAPAATGSPFGLLAAATAALCDVRAGENGEAQSLIGWLTPLMERAGPATHIHPLAVATTAAAVWEMEAVPYAGVYRRLALDLLGMGATVTPMGPLSLAVARMAALGGDMVEAEAQFARARQVADATDCRPFRAMVDYDEAQGLIRAGSPDTERTLSLLDAALGGLRALGMQDWVQRAERLRDVAIAQRPPAPGAAGHRRAAHIPPYPDGLTAREVQVLLLVADGKTNKEIAEQLVLSIATVQRHVANIYNKIDARNRSDATSYALRHHLATPDLA